MNHREACIQAQNDLIRELSLDANDARLEVQLLLQTAAKVNRAWLIAHENDALEPNIHAEFQALIKRRLKSEPIAYILGKREFYGLDLIVTPDTLIPRPDTETLVEVALANILVGSHYSVLDLGTGTGAIALAIAKNRPKVNVVAVDASMAALDVAKKNALNFAITNVEFTPSNWFDNLNNRRFDVIVSNPPYIAQHDAHLTQGDLRFEPASALASGVDGLDDIHHIITNCLIYLHPQGWLMLEHGYGQAEQVANLMAETGLVDIETFKDLGQQDRVTIGKNPLIVSTHWD